MLLLLMLNVLTYIDVVVHIDGDYDHSFNRAYIDVDVVVDVQRAHRHCCCFS